MQTKEATAGRLYENSDRLLSHFPDNGGFFQYRFVETAAAMGVGTTLMGQMGNFIFRIGFHQFVTMRAGIICNRNANGTDAWVGSQALKRHSGGGKLS
jgi:hypothetical protein